MRLGDLDALKRAIEDRIDYVPSNDYDEGWNSAINTAIDEIDNAPTVEITEEQAIDKLHETGWLPNHDKEMTARPQGKWIYKEFDAESGISRSYWCSNCGEPKSQWCDDFCQRCGADMRGEDYD